MANQIENEVLEEGWRNAIVKLTGVLDTSDTQETPAIVLKDFVSNDIIAGSLVGLRVDHVWYSIGDGLEVQLTWAGVEEKVIMAIAGRGKQSFDVIGGLRPDMTRLGYTGDINLYTTGFGRSNTGTAPQNFTITLEMAKMYKS